MRKFRPRWTQYNKKWTKWNDFQWFFQSSFYSVSIFWIMWLDKNSIVPNCTCWKVDPVGVSRFPSQHISLSQVAHPVRHCPHPSLPGHLIRIFHENKIERMKNMFKVRLCTKNKQTYQLVIAHPILKPYFEICILPYLVYNSISMSYHNAKHTVQPYTAKSSNICEYFTQTRTTHLKP